MCHPGLLSHGGYRPGQQEEGEESCRRRGGRGAEDAWATWADPEWGTSRAVVSSERKGRVPFPLPTIPTSSTRS